MYIQNRLASLLFKILVLCLSGFGLLINTGLIVGAPQLTSLTYFTVLCSLFCFAYYLFAAVWGAMDLARRGKKGSTSVALHMKGAVIITSITSFILYQFMLLPTGTSPNIPSALGTLGNILCSYAVPLCVVLDWALFDRKGRFYASDPVVWLLFPYLYYAFILVRAQLGLVPLGGSPYPYTFIDAEQLGWTAVLIYIAIFTGAFLVLGYILFGVDHFLGYTAKKNAKKRKYSTETPAPPSVPEDVPLTANDPVFARPSAPVAEMPALADEPAFTTYSTEVVAASMVRQYESPSVAVLPTPPGPTAPQEPASATASQVADEASFVPVEEIFPSDLIEEIEIEPPYVAIQQENYPSFIPEETKKEPDAEVIPLNQIPAFTPEEVAADNAELEISEVDLYYPSTNQDTAGELTDETPLAPPTPVADTAEAPSEPSTSAVQHESAPPQTPHAPAYEPRSFYSPPDQNSLPKKETYVPHSTLRQQHIPEPSIEETPAATKAEIFTAPTPSAPVAQPVVQPQPAQAPAAPVAPQAETFTAPTLSAPVAQPVAQPQPAQAPAAPQVEAFTAPTPSTPVAQPAVQPQPTQAPATPQVEAFTAPTLSTPVAQPAAQPQPAQAPAAPQTHTFTAPASSAPVTPQPMPQSQPAQTFAAPAPSAPVTQPATQPQRTPQPRPAQTSTPPAPVQPKRPAGYGVSGGSVVVPGFRPVTPRPTARPVQAAPPDEKTDK